MGLDDERHSQRLKIRIKGALLTTQVRDTVRRLRWVLEVGVQVGEGLEVGGRGIHEGGSLVVVEDVLSHVRGLHFCRGRIAEVEKAVVKGERGMRISQICYASRMWIVFVDGKGLVAEGNLNRTKTRSG